MADDNPQRFANLTFDDYRRMAADPSLSPHEKIGFPDAYRAGKTEAIMADVLAKAGRLGDRDRTVLDIGPGCGELAHAMIAMCATQGHRLVLVDSEEMLAQLPDAPHLTKLPGYFPACPALFAEHEGRIDVVLAYSVLHYVFTEGNLFRFLDSALALLAPGGQALLGDLPNVSMRKRFFASENGARFHHAFMQTDDDPEVHFNRLEPDQLDDAVVFSLLARARAAGFDAYLLPQRPDLPMANRREDILIRRP